MQSFPYQQVKSYNITSALHHALFESRDSEWNDGETLQCIQKAITTYIDLSLQNQDADLTAAMNSLRSSILEILLLRFPHHLSLKNDGEFKPVDVEEHLAELISNVQNLFRTCLQKFSKSDPTMGGEERNKIWQNLKQKLDIEQGFYDAQITAIAEAMNKKEKLAECLRLIIAELVEWLALQSPIPDILDIETHAYSLLIKYPAISVLFKDSGVSTHLLLQYCAEQAMRQSQLAIQAEYLTLRSNAVHDAKQEHQWGNPETKSVTRILTILADRTINIKDWRTNIALLKRSILSFLLSAFPHHLQLERGPDDEHGMEAQRCMDQIKNTLQKKCEELCTGNSEPKQELWPKIESALIFSEAFTSARKREVLEARSANSSLKHAMDGVTLDLIEWLEACDADTLSALSLLPETMEAKAYTILRRMDDPHVMRILYEHFPSLYVHLRYCAQEAVKTVSEVMAYAFCKQEVADVVNMQSLPLYILKQNDSCPNIFDSAFSIVEGKYRKNIPPFLQLPPAALKYIYDITVSRAPSENDARKNNINTSEEKTVHDDFVGTFIRDAEIYIHQYVARRYFMPSQGDIDRFVLYCFFEYRYNKKYMRLFNGQNDGAVKHMHDLFGQAVRNVQRKANFN